MIKREGVLIRDLQNADIPHAYRTVCPVMIVSLFEVF